MSGCSISTISLLHAISEEEAAPWPTEFNPDRRNSALPAVPTAPSNRTGTPESGASHCPGQNQLRVATFPPASASSINFHPGVTQSDSEAAAAAARLVGVVTSPLALRRSNDAASNRLRAAHSFIKNSRESSSCATTNSTNKQRPSSNTALSSGGGGGCVRVRVHSQSSPSPRKQPQAASEVKRATVQQRQQYLRQSSTEEDSDTNSMRSAGFGD